MTVLTRVPLTLPFLALGWLAAPSFGQSVLYTFDGPSALDYFGASVSGAGDVNGDGFADLIVGAVLDDTIFSGAARVFSGVDGSLLYTFVGDQPQDHFGFSVSGAGDVNGDGFADVIVGAPFGELESRGSASVFSGKDGSVLYTFCGDLTADALGISVSDAGDVNGDGFDDVVVGARPVHFGMSDKREGYARVFSGKDGSVISTFYGEKPGDGFGDSVSGAGDVNGDGFPDLIVGVPDDFVLDRGSAWVFSGRDGSTLYKFNGDSAGDHFGFSVSGAGDMNGDGFADLIVGAFGDDNKTHGSGSARVFSGVDGSVIYTFDGNSPGDWFGWSVSDAGDVNGDGFVDLIVGTNPVSNGIDPGSARVFSGKDGSILYTLDGDSVDDAFGYSVSGAGDVNGDGLADLIVGAPFDDNNGITSGSARVFSGCNALGTSYCPAVPNSSGQPAVISACGSDLADGGYFMLHATDLPLNQVGYFLASETQGFIANPGGSQGNLCLSGNIGRLNRQVQNSGAAGSFTIQVDLMNIPTNPPQSVMAGQTWNFQAWFRDNNPGPTSNFTDGVSITFL